jgi:hypothetical protein
MSDVSSKTSAIDDENTTGDSPITELGEDGRAHLSEDMKPPSKLPRRQDQPSVLSRLFARRMAR